MGWVVKIRVDMMPAVPRLDWTCPILAVKAGLGLENIRNQGQRATCVSASQPKSSLTLQNRSLD